VLLEDVANRLIGDLVTQIGQGTLDLVVSPGCILPRKANHKIDDLLPYTWSAYRFAALTVVPFLSYQFSMLTKNCVRSNNRG
jgi:hypothetical protein